MWWLQITQMYFCCFILQKILRSWYFSLVIEGNQTFKMVEFLIIYSCVWCFIAPSFNSKYLLIELNDADNQYLNPYSVNGSKYSTGMKLKLRFLKIFQLHKDKDTYLINIIIDLFINRTKSDRLREFQIRSFLSKPRQFTYPWHKQVRMLVKY